MTLHPIIDDDFGRNIQLAWRNSDPRAVYLEKFGRFIQSQMHADDMLGHLLPQA